MPRIQEYLPQENASGPQGAATPNLEQVTAAGRGIEAFGREIGDASDLVYQRQAQMETAQAYNDVADYKVDLLQKQQQALQDGTYDNFKFTESYKDWQNTQSDQYETPQGRNAFMRASSRALGAVMSRGNNIQQTISYNNAASSFQDSIDKLATATRIAPDTYEDNIDAITEQAHDVSDQHSLRPADRENLLLHAKQVITAEHIKGVADTDPDKARDLLDNPDVAGGLKPADYDSLLKTVTAAQKAQDLDDDITDAKQKKMNQAIMDKYMTNSMPDIINGKLSMKDLILKSPSSVDFDTKQAYVEKAYRLQMGIEKPNPIAMEQARQRLLLPKDDPNAVTSIDQLVREQGLNLTDANALQKWYLQQPQGKAEAAAEKLMTNDINARLKVPGMPDQDSASRIANAISSYQKAKAQVIKDGGDPRDLTDPSSSKYFPNTIRRANAVEIMQNQAKEMQDSLKTVPPPANPQNPQSTPQSTERRKVGNKVAIFDSKTKQFIKYEGEK